MKQSTSRAESIGITTVVAFMGGGWLMSPAFYIALAFNYFNDGRITTNNIFWPMVIGAFFFALYLNEPNKD